MEVSQNLGPLRWLGSFWLPPNQRKKQRPRRWSILRSPHGRNTTTFPHLAADPKNQKLEVRVEHAKPSHSSKESKKAQPVKWDRSSNGKLSDLLVFLFFKGKPPLHGALFKQRHEFAQISLSCCSCPNKLWGGLGQLSERAAEEGSRLLGISPERLYKSHMNPYVTIRWLSHKLALSLRGPCVRLRQRACFPYA